jgi:hypothetical protein
MRKSSFFFSRQFWNIWFALTLLVVFLPNLAKAQLPGGGLEGGGGGGGGGGGPYPFQWNYFHYLGLEVVPSSTLIKFKYTLDHNWVNPTGTPFAPYIQATMGGTNTSETKLLLSSDLTAGYHEVTFDCQVDNGLGTVQLFMIPVVVDEHDGVMQHFETHGDTVTLTSPLLGVIGNILLPSAPPCIPCGVKTSPSGLNLLPYTVSMATADFQLHGMLKSSFQPPCEACAKKGGSAVADSGNGPSAGAGCSSCGGGGETNPTPILLPVEPKPFVEYSIYHSAFGPGMMSGVDASLYMVASAPGSNANYTARLFDPNLGVATLFQDVTSSNPTGDNILHDSLNRYDRMVKTVDSATVYYHDGSQLVFALEDNDLDTTDKQGVLTAMVNRDGEVQYEINYSDRPNRIISYVKDKYGYQINFTYGPVVAGRKAVSSVSFCGTTVNFGYANDFLSSVSMPEGWAWTCAVGFDATAQAVTLTVNSPEFGIQKHYLSPDFMEYQNQLYGQPSNLLRLVLDKDGNPVVGVFHNPNNNNEILKLYAGNKLSMLKPARSERFATSWTFIPSGNPGWNSFQNVVLEDAYGGKGYSNIAGEAEQQMLKSTPGYIQSITGEQIVLGYDSDGYIVEETYPDASTITYQLDDYKNVLRMKDRRGNVTLMEYNSGNHLTRRREGMIVVNGADVPGPDYGEYNYVWSGSKLISERGPLSTGAGSTMHRTDYEYSAAGQLTKVIQASDTEGGPRGSTTYAYNTCGLVTSITDA